MTFQINSDLLSDHAHELLENLEMLRDYNLVNLEEASKAKKKRDSKIDQLFFLCQYNTFLESFLISQKIELLEFRDFLVLYHNKNLAACLHAQTKDDCDDELISQETFATMPLAGIDYAALIKREREKKESEDEEDE